jgi:hypothetical protein
MGPLTKCRPRIRGDKSLSTPIVYVFRCYCLCSQKPTVGISKLVHCKIATYKTGSVVEHVFERLVNWAAAAIETSSNQPVLPHAIIVLNATENDIDPIFWDVNVNTNVILDDLAKTVNQNETFKKYAQTWRQRGKTIDTLEQLLLSYYSSLQVGLFNTG